MDELVLTILSQNTNDRNRDRAFQKLKRTFHSWQEVAEAPLSLLMETISEAGLWAQKAPRIQAALKEIKGKFGDYSIPAPNSPSELLFFLLSLKGVGPKTARCVLLFSFGLPFFPIDRHILRVGRRFGLIGERENLEKAMERLEKEIKKNHLELHLLLISHGREVCQPRPRCEICSLTDICLYYNQQIISP